MFLPDLISLRARSWIVVDSRGAARKRSRSFCAGEASVVIHNGLIEVAMMATYLDVAENVALDSAEGYGTQDILRTQVSISRAVRV